MPGKKVMVCMSGGVDSSLASFLLKEEKYRLVGVNMKFVENSCTEKTASKKSCCSFEEGEDARSIAQKLDIPFYLINRREKFRKEIIDYFCREYSRGKTPSPCIYCNQKLKFDLAFIKIFDVDFIATGHYARTEHDKERGRYLLKKGLDANKDQSYFLFSLNQEQLSHALFPLGSYTKEKTRAKAKEAGLKTSKKKESQETCFIPDGDNRRFFQEKIPEKIIPGPIIDTSGKIRGEHQGIIFYTIGQRKGLGIANEFPLYVLSIDKEKNTIMVGKKEDIYRDEFLAGEINWIAFDKLNSPLKVKARIRYRHKEADATIYPLSETNVRVKFDLPQLAITPGQAVVFYDDDLVIGGGWTGKVGSYDNC